MGILTNKQIIKHLKDGKLIKNARKAPDGEFEVEGASYDLCIGVAVRKKHGDKPFQKRHEIYNYEATCDCLTQKTISLSPGQMVYVITHEEVLMPEYLCGTVYSRNSLALNGILALNAGHIDPGYSGPITIKLINLRSVACTFTMGEPIFTIVFHKLEPNSDGKFEPEIRKATKQEMLKRIIKVTDESLDNALYDLSLLREFVKENEMGRALRKWFFRTFWGWVTFIIGSVIALMSLIVTCAKLWEIISPLINNAKK